MNTPQFDLGTMLSAPSRSDAGAAGTNQGQTGSKLGEDITTENLRYVFTKKCFGDLAQQSVGSSPHNNCKSG